MNNNQPNIIFNCPENFPDELVDLLTSDIKSDKLNLQINKVPNEPWMAVEWTIPGLIAIFLTQSYFGGVLKEIGKEHYLILKRWIKKTAIESRKMYVITLTAKESTKKIDKSNKQSKAFSIYIQTADNRNLKLLFDLELSDEVWESSIDKIVDLTYNNFKNFPNYELSKKIAELETESRHIYALINPNTNDWEFLDQSRLIKMAKSKNVG